MLPLENRFSRFRSRAQILICGSLLRKPQPGEHDGKHRALAWSAGDMNGAPVLDDHPLGQRESQAARRFMLSLGIGGSIRVLEDMLQIGRPIPGRSREFPP